jgi:hypothetical protein
MARIDDTGIPPTDARGTQITKSARVVYSTARGGGLLQEGVITRVTPGICIRRPDGKVIALGSAKRVAVLRGLPREPQRPNMSGWVEYCKRNREHALGRWADEELRLAHERLRQREKDQWNNWREEP